MNPFAATGRLTLDTVGEIGRIAQFAIKGSTGWLGGRFYWRAFWSAFIRIGYASLPVVGLTAIFTGAALALNIYDGSLRFNAESFLPQIVGVSIVRELAPVSAALMVAGRCSSAMAAEIGAMRASEQIDAMSTLSVNPISYLVTPRMMATTLALPLLVFIADIIGIYGGYLVAVYALDFSGPSFIRNIDAFLQNRDVISGIIKAGVFGYLISLMGCYYGFTSRGGAQGVGSSTRTAVVAAAVMVLASNYFMTSLLVEI